MQASFATSAPKIVCRLCETAKHVDRVAIPYVFCYLGKIVVVAVVVVVVWEGRRNRSALLPSFFLGRGYLICACLFCFFGFCFGAVNELAAMNIRLTLGVK